MKQAQPSGFSNRNLMHASAFLAPFLATYILLLVYPFLLGLWMSLHDWELMAAAARIPPVFTGLQNYRRLVSDSFFWSSFWHTIVFAALAVPSITITSLLLALALNRQTRKAAILRGVFFVSSVFSVTVVTLIWLAILSPARGLAGCLLEALGFEKIDFLANPHFAMPVLVLATLWWSVGVPMALFLAGLQQIPVEVYEAAALDGATRWSVFRRITLPALRRTMWLVLVLQVISHFQVFGQVLLLTGGGPANLTRVLVQYIYETSFRDWEMGYASALSAVLFVIMMIASLAQLRISRQEDG